MSWGKNWPETKRILDKTEIKNYKLNDPVPLDGDKLATKKDWVNSSDYWPTFPKQTFAEHDKAVKEYTDLYGTEINPVALGVKSTLTKQGSNLVDNNQYLYFQCETCAKLFDPHTRSFAALNQKRYEAGWLVKWNVDGMGYKVYCTECKEGVK